MSTITRLFKSGANLIKQWTPTFVGGAVGAACRLFFPVVFPHKTSTPVTPSLTGRVAPLALTEAPTFSSNAHAVALGHLLTHTREPAVERTGQRITSFLSDFVFGIRAPFITEQVLNDAMGYFTGLGAMTSLFYMTDVKRQIQKARAVEDGWATLQGGLSLGSEISTFLYSIGYFVDRVASVAVSGDTGVKVASLGGRVSAYSSIVADGAFAVFGAFISLAALASMGEIGAFGVAFERSAIDQVERMRFLQKSVSFDAKDYVKDNQEKLTNEHLEELGLDVLIKETNAQDKEAIGTASREEVKQHFETIFQDPAKAKWYKNQMLQMLQLGDKDVTGLSPLALCGLAEEIRRRIEQKQDKMNRLLGSQVTNTIKKIHSTGLVERLQAASKHPEIGKTAAKEAQKLTSSVRMALVKKVVGAFILLASGVLSVTLGIMSIMMTVGAATFPPALITGILIALFIGFVILDVGGFKEAIMSSKKPSTLDYVILGISVVTLLASFFTTLGLVIVLKYAASALIKPGIILGFGLVMNAFSAYRLYQRKHEWIKEHPTLQVVINALEGATGQVDKKTAKLFKKLSKEDRKAVKARLHKASHYNQGPAFFTDKSLKDAGHYVRCERGIKKAAKRAWENYHRSSTDRNFQTALQIQRLLDLVKENQMLDLVKENKTQAVIDHLEKISAPAYAMVMDNVRAIVKREESAEELRKAVIETAKIPASILTGARA